jgi:glycosyltransferase involved in cell wall biosynthesis
MGSGTRLKLLEAMAMGKAIVSTKLGAAGLTGEEHTQRSTGVERTEPEKVGSTDTRATHDQELVLVNDNDPNAFADAVVALLLDPARRARLGSAARAYVQTHFDWQVIIPRLEAVYAESR